jgi:hypothetical protein
MHPSVFLSACMHAARYTVRMIFFPIYGSDLKRKGAAGGGSHRRDGPRVALLRPHFRPSKDTGIPYT